MNHEPCGPPATVARPSRVRTALSTAVPIALAAHTRLASEVASGAAGIAKWPNCAGD
jgi:hypothetical protein